ncbi:MAG: hypothetical protein A3K19_20155 [Lentisphaerae bacterium RIFOXYB12_FULL_65_16]|nr:MAG: hypothetical protein A3K18_11235 [Lentisphaerae bacterium RIFOXYA12_64_32]OGV91776.1 MAG: hypothetical protein A3K19_20155 [Lentisphaerae bacterium RIFOXYB12_FULL_65_16]
MTHYTPFVLLGPGDSIAEELQFYGWNRRTLAAELGLSYGEAVHLLHNRLPVTRALATRLGNAFGQSPKFWLNLDAQYRARLATRSTAEEGTNKQPQAQRAGLTVAQGKRSAALGNGNTGPIRPEGPVHRI